MQKTNKSILSQLANIATILSFLFAIFIYFSSQKGNESVQINQDTPQVPKELGEKHV